MNKFNKYDRIIHNGYIGFIIKVYDNSEYLVKWENGRIDIIDEKNLDIF